LPLRAGLSIPEALGKLLKYRRPLPTYVEDQKKEKVRPASNMPA